MKYYYLAFLSLILSFNANAQRDTVYIDINDSTQIFKNLPTGYVAVDTIGDAYVGSYLLTGYTGMSNNPNCTWNGLTPSGVDTLQNLFVHWGYKNSSGTSTGSVYLKKDSTIIDSIALVNNGIPVNYSDTFPTNSFTSLYYKERGIGLDTMEFRVGFFQIRTEIRITLVTDLEEQLVKPNQLSLYPNPANSRINFKNFNTIQSELYEVYDITGKIITSGFFNKNELDISDFKRGLYILLLPQQQQVYRFQKL